MPRMYFKPLYPFTFKDEIPSRPIEGTIAHCPVIVDLGDEVEDLSHHTDRKTEYRKFIECSIKLITEDDTQKQILNDRNETKYLIWLICQNN